MGETVVSRWVMFAVSCTLVSACAHVDPVDVMVREEMIDRGLPGVAFAIVKDGSLADTRTYGVADLEHGASVRDDTVFAIGSITKSMTAIAAMKLVERGQLRLDASVLEYAPDLPAGWRAVTVVHALSNTSGLADLIDNPCRSPPHPDYTLMDVIAEVDCLPLEFEPGERFSYSNTNFIVLSLLIERITGQSLDNVLEETIFTPLGMQSTRMADFETVIVDRAQGYFVRDGTAVNVPDFDPAVEAGAGGVISTAGDMAKFIRGLNNPALLSQSSWDRLFTSPAVREGATPYALGFGVSPYEGERRIGHNGAAPGFASSLAWFPDRRVGVILLSNGYEEPHGRSVMSLANGIARHYFD